MLFNPDNLALILVFAPLLGALVVGMNSQKISDWLAQTITTLLMFISLICSFIIFYQVVSYEIKIHLKLLSWFNIGSLQAHWSIYVDVLTAVMFIVVNSVSALVHMYSIGYMSHDPHKPRFMAYLSLFTFCMLMLVCADNFIQLFFGWEGVGLCSYLLIGFWYKKKSAYLASIKAFLVNRVGDMGLILGIFVVLFNFGSVEYSEVFSKADIFSNDVISFMGYEFHMITIACILIFIGCMGKSAQIGLHTWLPDAMEGPTPVSALIHAATMVTAGVFLVSRCSPLFEYSALALQVVTVVGAITCLFAATIALVQNDIKRIIAYSTCSQLGYMFFACGVSAYAGGIFHLATHAFFKALLFLSAGSVIHAMSDEQNIMKMGGIWRKIPFTFAMMWIGSLALAGIFPFAGFYSKDLILEAAYASNSKFGYFAYVFGIMAAILTAFYSWRLLILVFENKTNASKKVYSHVHESPFMMTIPLALLALGAVFSGMIGVNGFHVIDVTHEFWQGALFVKPENNPLEAAHHVPLLVKLSATIVAILGISFAYFLYKIKPNIPTILMKRFSYVYSFLINKWFFDAIYNRIFVCGAMISSSILWKRIDIGIIDFIPNFTAFVSQRGSRLLRIAQSGYVYTYAYGMLVGLIIFIMWVTLNH